MHQGVLPYNQTEVHNVKKHTKWSKFSQQKVWPSLIQKSKETLRTQKCFQILPCLLLRAFLQHIVSKADLMISVTSPTFMYFPHETPAVAFSACSRPLMTSPDPAQSNFERDGVNGSSPPSDGFIGVSFSSTLINCKAGGAGRTLFTKHVKGAGRSQDMRSSSSSCAKTYRAPFTSHMHFTGRCWGCKPPVSRICST